MLELVHLMLGYSNVGYFLLKQKKQQNKMPKKNKGRSASAVRPVDLASDPAKYIAAHIKGVGAVSADRIVELRRLGPLTFSLVSEACSRVSEGQWKELMASGRVVPDLRPSLARAGPTEQPNPERPVLAMQRPAENQQQPEQAGATGGHVEPDGSLDPGSDAASEEDSISSVDYELLKQDIKKVRQSLKQQEEERLSTTQILTESLIHLEERLKSLEDNCISNQNLGDLKKDIIDSQDHKLTKLWKDFDESMNRVLQMLPVQAPQVPETENVVEFEAQDKPYPIPYPSDGSYVPTPKQVGFQDPPRPSQDVRFQDPPRPSSDVRFAPSNRQAPNPYPYQSTPQPNCNMDRPEFSYSTIHGATHARGAEFTPIDRTYTPAATSRNYDFRGMNQDYDPRTSYYRSRGEEFRTPNSKLPTYDGSLSWDPFIFQFENIASRSGWFDDGVKKGRLLECLRGDALQHYMYVAQEGSYEHVKSKMRQLYQIDMTPTTARINARELKQTEDESEEAFAKRLYKVIRMGYLHMGEVAMNQIAIDVFIQGCRNSEAKRAVLKDDPCNLSDAIQAMKQAIAADNIVTGKTRKDSAKQKSTEYSVKQTVVEEETQEEDCDDELSAKQVRFQKKSFREQPTPPRKQAQQVVASTSSERSGNQQSSRPSRDAQPLLRVEDFQQVLRQELAGMLKDMRSSFSKDAESKTPSSRPPNNPSSPSKNSSGSPARLSRPFYCYGCGDFGHYKFSCPYASPGGTTRLPPRQPQPLNSQGQGSKTTNS